MTLTASRQFLSARLYILITEEFNLRHDVELVDHLGLYEYPTAVHEHMSRTLDEWVHASYEKYYKAWVFE